MSSPDLIFSDKIFIIRSVVNHGGSVHNPEEKKKSIHDKHSPCSLLLMTQPDGHWVILSDAALTNPVFPHSILC